MEVQNNNSVGMHQMYNYVGSLLLERCSLLLVQDDLYEKYLHGIRELTHDDKKDIDLKNLQFCEESTESILKRDRRISLTIRHVPKVVKAKLLLKIK